MKQAKLRNPEVPPNVVDPGVPAEFKSQFDEIMNHTLYPKDVDSGEDADDKEEDPWLAGEGWCASSTVFFLGSSNLMGK
jgi:hypothetical protein